MEAQVVEGMVTPTKARRFRPTRIMCRKINALIRAAKPRSTEYSDTQIQAQATALLGVAIPIQTVRYLRRKGWGTTHPAMRRQVRGFRTVKEQTNLKDLVRQIRTLLGSSVKVTLTIEA